MARRPIVLLHGYGGSSESLGRWREILLERGYDATEVHLGGYISLSNEITIKDLAEAFDRALRIQSGLDADEEFDAIVHSTGGLVIREWLTTYATRRERVKRIIGLAPAMFGSPLAHKGRSWLGAIFKGEKEQGPDFMEAGTQILAGLEMGSSYTWRLAHRDLLTEQPAYGEGADTPYPFIFIGLDGYGGIRGLFTNPEGSDGTIRWAAAGLNVRKLVLDLRQEPGVAKPPSVTVAPWTNVNVPLVFVRGCNHGTIVSDPPQELVDMAMMALSVEDSVAYTAWAQRYASAKQRARAVGDKHEWQQFVVHAVDERGDPVPDYYMELGTIDAGEFTPLKNFSLDTHPFTDDPSYRCLHVDLGNLRPDDQRTLQLRLIAQSGTELVAYYGHNSETFTAAGEHEAQPGKWDAKIDLTPWLRDEQVRFFYPFTTTLVEIQLNREPMPPTGVTTLLKFFQPE
ncbi:MAG: alpha/beta fold hydrolase [Chloroflexota bacterium]|nr:alpha/beta fold hydrolase [Chloroflexota bacterium]